MPSKFSLDQPGALSLVPLYSAKQKTEYPAAVHHLLSYLTVCRQWTVGVGNASVNKKKSRESLFIFNVSEARSLCKPSVTGEIAIFFEAVHKHVLQLFCVRH